METMSFQDELNKKLENKQFKLFELFPITHLEMRHSEVIASLLKNKEYRCYLIEVLISKLNVNQKNTSSILKSIEDVGDDKIKLEEPLESFGRADIFIEGKNGEKIIIENKIYAHEGYRQIEKYQKYLFEKEKGLIIFLTLNGRSARIKKVSDVCVISLSYSHDILRWLKRCILNLKISDVMRSEIFLYYLYLNVFCTEYIVCNELVKQFWNEPKYFKEWFESGSFVGINDPKRMRMYRNVLMRSIVLKIKCWLENSGELKGKIEQYCEDFSNSKYPGFCIVLKNSNPIQTTDKVKVDVKKCLRFQIESWGSECPQLAYGISYLQFMSNVQHKGCAYPITKVMNRPEPSSTSKWWEWCESVVLGEFVPSALSQLKAYEVKTDSNDFLDKMTEILSRHQNS